MTRRFGAVIACAVLVGLAAPAQRAQGQHPFAGAVIRHVGVIVADVDKAAAAYADLLGLPAPATREVPGVPFPESYRGDRAAHPKVTSFRLNNVSIELLEPIGGPSPWRDHLDQFGEGLHHIAFGVPDLQAAVAYLEEKGGKYLLGAPDYPAAYVDLKPLLGFTAELSEMSGSAQPQTPPAQRSANFGSNPISHVGIFVRDVEQSAQLFGELMGMDVPEANAYTGLQFPADFDGDRNAHPKIISFRPEGSPISIEFAEPQGGKSPWRDHLDRFGPSMHHLAFGISGMSEQVAYLEEKGGHLVLGGSGGVGYAFVDLKPKPLGFSIELNGQ